MSSWPHAGGRQAHRDGGRVSVLHKEAVTIECDPAGTLGTQGCVSQSPWESGQDIQEGFLEEVVPEPVLKANLAEE